MGRNGVERKVHFAVNILKFIHDRFHNVNSHELFKGPHIYTNAHIHTQTALVFAD